MLNIARLWMTNQITFSHVIDNRHVGLKMRKQRLVLQRGESVDEACEWFNMKELGPVFRKFWKQGINNE